MKPYKFLHFCAGLLLAHFCDRFYHSRGFITSIKVMQFQFIEEINRSYIRLRILSDFNKKCNIHAFSAYTKFYN